MKLATLLIQEIRHRSWSSIILLLLICMAVAASLSTLSFIKDYELGSIAAIEQKAADTAERMKKMEDDYRRITKKMGFNILILPKEQDLGSYYADDDHSAFMPEQYVHTLAQSKIVTRSALTANSKTKTQMARTETESNFNWSQG